MQNIGKYIPIPFLITFFFVLISVIASKCHKKETFFPGCIVGLAGILEWGSWVTLFFLSILMNNQTYRIQEIIFLATLLGVN